jgi:sugar phosphate isomerase/epimerase
MISLELMAPGLGILNYELFQRRLSAIHPNIQIIIEHPDEPDIPEPENLSITNLNRQVVKYNLHYFQISTMIKVYN